MGKIKIQGSTDDIAKLFGLFGKTVSINADDLGPKLDRAMEKILNEAIGEIQAEQYLSGVVNDMENMSRKLADRKAKNKEEPKKWQPSGGSWFVYWNGEVQEVSPERNPCWWNVDMQKALESGRLYETEQQAVVAGRMQRAFMRFVRWCFEQDPEFESLGYFSELLTSRAMAQKAKEVGL